MIVHGTNHETISNFSMIYKGASSLEITLCKEDSGFINLAMIMGYPINGVPKNISMISFNMINPTTSEATVNNIFTTDTEKTR